MFAEIGSNFWTIPVDNYKENIDETIFNCDYKDIYFSSTGRSGIQLILEEIKNSNKQALLPAFTCDSVIQSFVKLGYEISFYNINRDFQCDLEDMKNKIITINPSILFVHSYFGFDTQNDVKKFFEEMRADGVVLIEDLTQSLYSHVTRIKSDYYVGSLRKWAGLPDGGFALKKEGLFEKKPTVQDTLLEKSKNEAMLKKYEFIVQSRGRKSDFLKKYEVAEKLLDSQKEIFAISNSSKKIQASLDIKQLRKRRRENFLQLLLDVGRNEKIELAFASLPKEIVPLYFPVFCKGRRKEIQALLREQNIYAPIIWPKSILINDTSEIANEIYEDLLCIPCDQRYKNMEMKRITKVLESI